MSHVEKIEAPEIRDLPSLRRACESLGWTLAQATTFRSYFPGEKCDLAISVPGANYQIGVAKTATGYELKMDSWSTGGLLGKIGGKGAPLLVQAYGVARVRAEAARRGYAVTERRLPNGQVKLRVMLPR